MQNRHGFQTYSENIIFIYSSLTKSNFCFTGLLVPLFGLHNFLAAFVPDEDGPAKLTINRIMAISISFQVLLTVLVILS